MNSLESGGGVISNTIDFQSIDAGAIPCSPLHVYLEEVKSAYGRKLFREIIEQFHSCVKQSQYVGRQVNFLIKPDKDAFEIWGILGFGSYVLPQSGALIRYIGWDKKQVSMNFNKVAINWRGCFLPDAPKNIGSKGLSIAAKILPNIWKNKYGDDLVLLVTFIHLGWEGTIYKGAGWTYIGQTAGCIMPNTAFRRGDRGWEAAIGKDNALTKKIFVKPLVPNWKEILCRNEA